MNNKIRKLQLGDYFKWKNLSREDKVKRNKQIAKLYLDKGPSILNYYNALKAYFGGFNPKNPYLLTGEPTFLPGMNPTKGILTATNVARTLEDYLKTTKVTAQALEGSSAARSAYATDRFIGGRLFLNTLPEEAMKILGHGMAKSPTILDALARLRYILDNGIKGKFYTAPLKVSREAAMAGEAIGTGGATPYFDGHFLITGKPGLMINSVDDIGTIYINDAYENEEALKAAQKMKEYLTKTYPNKVFKLYSEGFKKGGTIKTANARKWKHLNGGVLLFFLFGGKTLEEVNVINNSNKNRAKGLFKGIISGEVLPTFRNIGDMLGSAYKGWLDPETTTINGAPNYLPGKVNMSVYKNAKSLLKGPQYDEGFVNFVERLSKGKINPNFITKNGTVSPANYNYVDLTSESVPKGFIKGNEITPSPMRNLAEEGLTVRTIKPIKTTIPPITNEAEALAAKDYLKMLEELGPKKVITKKTTTIKPDPIKQPILLKVPKKTLALKSKEYYHEKVEDKNIGYGRLRRKSFNQLKSLNDGDMRHANSGQNAIHNRLIDEDFNTLGNYKEYRAEFNRIQRALAKYEKNSFGYKQAVKSKRDLVRRYRAEKRFKQGGRFILAQEGTKLNFFLKAGNFLNSELGKSLISGITNGVQGIINTNKQLELYNEYLNFLEENYKYEKSKDIAEKYKKALLNKSDLSDIVNANSAYIEANTLNDDTEFNLLKLYYLNLIKQNQQQGYYNAFVGLGNSVIGMLNSNKNASPSTTNKA